MYFLNTPQPNWNRERMQVYNCKKKKSKNIVQTITLPVFMFSWCICDTKLFIHTSWKVQHSTQSAVYSTDKASVEN